MNTDEKNDLLLRILGDPDVAWGPDCYTISHTKWSPTGYGSDRVCTSYCARCEIEKRILLEWARIEESNAKLVGANAALEQELAQYRRLK